MIKSRGGQERSAFTLMELLVVITIIAILATLALAIYPRISPAQRTAQGASQLQGWLLVAKQRAYRDRVPRGVRLIRDADGYIRSLAYAEQPDDFSLGSPNNTPMPDPNMPTPPTSTVGFTLPAGASFLESCSPNDYLLLGYDLKRSNLYRIVSRTANSLTISPSLRSNVFSGDPYRIIRAPREIESEPRLQLPVDIVIDPAPFGATNPPPLPPNDMIIFSPTGGCSQDGVMQGKFILYVRDVTLPNSVDGEPTLITVYTRTGAIAAHPVNLDPTQPWLFTQDGRSSGM